MLTTAEAAFVSRMADLVAADPMLSIEDAARQVIARDRDLYGETFRNDDAGEETRDVITQTVFMKCRK